MKIPSLINFKLSESAQGSVAIIVKVISGAAALAIVVRLIAWELSNRFAVPQLDDLYDHLKLYRSLRGPYEFLRYMLSSHNEHHITTTRIIALADEYLGQGREQFQIIATHVCQLLCAILIFRTYVDHEEPRQINLIDRLWVFTLILLYFINPNFLYTLIYPFQVQHAIMALICVFAAYIVAQASAIRPLHGREMRVLVGQLVGLAAVASITLGNAPVVLISAALAALVLRWKWPLVAVLAGLAVAHTILMMIWSVPVGSNSHDFFGVFEFAALYLGGPFIRLGPWPAGYVTWWGSDDVAGMFGATILVIGICFAVVSFRRPGWGGSLAVLGFVLVVIAGVTGLASGYSRLQFGLEEAINKKYASFSALGWIGSLMIIAGGIRHHYGPRHALNAWLIAAALVIILPLSEIGYDRETRIWQKAIERNWEAGVAAFLRVTDRNYIQVIYPPGPDLAEYVQYIDSHNRAIFSHFPFRWGDDLKQIFAHRRETTCRSVVETVTRIAAIDLTTAFQAPGTQFRVSGWTWMETERAPASSVVVADARDRIVGLAHTTRRSANAEEWLSQKFDENLGWFGFARMAEPSPLRFFALSADGRYFCVLGGQGNAR